MSAYIVSKKHIDLIVKAVTEGTRDGIVPPSDQDPDALGQLLVTECVASVSYRYPDDDVQAGELPGPCDPYYLLPYTYADPLYRPTAAELYSAIRAYSYQSCEHPGWEDSDANTVCETAQEDIRCRLPVARRYHGLRGSAHSRRWDDMQTAPWSWEAESIALCFLRSTTVGIALLRAAEADSTNWLLWHTLSDYLADHGHDDIDLTGLQRSVGVYLAQPAHA